MPESKTKNLFSGSPIEEIVRKIRAEISSLNFKDSGSYWETRYKTQGNSGAGSYGRLAEFKAEIINDFVKENGVETIIEYGCGDGNQLSLMNYSSYLGFDVSTVAVESCNERFLSDETKSFALYADYQDQKADLTLSLDVIYHLIEDEVFDLYMSRLFDSSNRFVIVYASNSEELNARIQARHVRHRCFTDWVEENRGAWTLIKKIDNKFPFSSSNPRHTSFADFYIFEKAD